MYSHGSTWRGGMGPNMYRMDICNLCWGSGNSAEPFLNLRDLCDRHAQELSYVKAEEYFHLQAFSREQLITVYKILKGVAEGRYARNKTTFREAALFDMLARMVYNFTERSKHE